MVSTISQPDAPSNQPIPVVDMTLEEFLKLPETKPASEFIDGKISQKPMPDGKHSTLQGELTSRINEIGKSNKLAYAFLELQCVFGNRSIVPDIVVLEWVNIPRREDGRVINNTKIVPNWIIEILSPDQRANQVIEKILFTLEHGTKLGWLIDPERELVMVFYEDQIPEIKSGNDQLPVIDRMQDWELSAVDLFSWLYIDL
jgi:Uma2 family endonuclease